MGQLALRAEGLRSDSAFSYICHRCTRCCHGKLIQVNPYEIARLARRLGISTTEFIAGHLDEGGQPYLRHGEGDACEFLGAEGCTVHPDRPLVCRVYPLGRHISSGQSEEQARYSVVVGHPRSEGEFGAAGTVRDYLSGQGVEPFVAAAEAYLSALQALYDAWRARGDAIGEPPEMMDMDLALAGHAARTGEAIPDDIEARAQLHLRILRDWAARG